MDYFSRICTEFPEFIGSDVRLVSDGAENDVIILDNKTVFRFPKIERTKRTLSRELCLLDTCSKYLSCTKAPGCVDDLCRKTSQVRTIINKQDSVPKVSLIFA